MAYIGASLYFGDAFMEKRRIQLVAGSTYSVSLPKEWVIANRLKEKNEVLIYERQDKTLVLSANPVEKMQMREIELNIDEHPQDIHQIIYAVYYLGIETIVLTSEKDLTKEVKTRIRKTLARMAGTEINYEDKRKIVIKVLLDHSKVEIGQILYRLNLLIEFSLDNISSDPNLAENEFTENEIDRLYHLLAKIITLALIDSNILHSSGINNVSLIPSYFLMSKKLEHIGDNASYLGEYLHENNLEVPDKEVVEFLKLEFHRATSHLMKKDNEIFDKIPFFEVEVQEKRIQKIKDSRARGYMENILRLLVDIEEEITNNSFYNQLIEEKVL